MNDSPLKSLSLGLLSIVAVIAAFFFVPTKSAADIEIKQNVITQGKTLTPAGKLMIDAATNLPAVAPLTMDFVRSPDKTGADGKGRFVIAVNSGYGLHFNSKSKAQQTLAVIDLNAQPEPQVVQNVYFPSPQSATFGAVFASEPEADGSFPLFVSGGVENKIWIFKFQPNEKTPLSPANKPDENVTAAAIDVSGFAANAPSSFTQNQTPVYPIGLAMSADNSTLFVANNYGDSLGVLEDWRGARKIKRIDLKRPNSTQLAYPYDVEVLPAKNNKTTEKVFVSLWADAAIAVVTDLANPKTKFIPVDRHPTAMILNREKTRLFVVNSNADSVSVIDTASEKVTEKISVKLAETEKIGASPEGLALSADEKTLFVANSNANAVAVVALEQSKIQNPKSKVVGFIPTGNYASAIFAVGNKLIVANGEGTGVEPSSNIVNNSGRNPNTPNQNFPKGEGRGGGQGGQYSVSVVSGNFSIVETPGEKQLFEYSQAVMRNNNLLGKKEKSIFPNNRSPFKHVIYIIRENRTYDQVFGDLPASGDGTKADGEPQFAIFGAGDAAKSPKGVSQNPTPNARAIALRFGLLDRFFVNAEASPDGHNWSTAAFSNDYVDKSFRWGYSGRSRFYDYEGFNRLPNLDNPATQPSLLKLPITATEAASFYKKYIPYTQGNRDVGEPETLYLWDAAKKAGLTHRNYGEYVGTLSQQSLDNLNQRKRGGYPDISKTVAAVPTKKTLENNFSPTFRNYDTNNPDSMTPESYRAAIETKADGVISETNANEKLRGNSRFGEWHNEFKGFVADLNAGKGDKMPNLSIVRFGNDHTAGLRAGVPTPQFYVAENDYAVGKLVEAVSNSPYWRDTAIFIVEDDAQDGPDHVDAHRSPAFVISAYNKKGALVHEFHNTVSLIRTMEICLGIEPMNFLDANATPIDIFTNQPDFTPFQAIMPSIALDNLTPPEKVTAAMQKYYDLTAKQDLIHADMANPYELNQIIWFSVRGENSPMPEIARLPAFDLLTAGVEDEDDDEAENEADED